MQSQILTLRPVLKVPLWVGMPRMGMSVDCNTNPGMSIFEALADTGNALQQQA